MYAIRSYYVTNSNSTPLTHVSSRGFRYERRNSVLNRCTKAMKIRRFADQLWIFVRTERNQPIDVP